MNLKLNKKNKNTIQKSGIHISKLLSYSHIENLNDYFEKDNVNDETIIIKIKKNRYT